MTDKEVEKRLSIKGLEVGLDVSTFEVIIRLQQGFGHTEIVFSPDQARELGETLRKKAEEAEYERASKVPPAVHALQFGLPVCGFARTLPGGWPPGHSWGDLGDVTCESCRREMVRRLHEMTVARKL